MYLQVRTVAGDHSPWEHEEILSEQGPQSKCGYLNHTKTFQNTTTRLRDQMRNPILSSQNCYRQTKLSTWNSERNVQFLFNWLLLSFDRPLTRDEGKGQGCTGLLCQECFANIFAAANYISSHSIGSSQVTGVVSACSNCGQPLDVQNKFLDVLSVNGLILKICINFIAKLVGFLLNFTKIIGLEIQNLHIRGCYGGLSDGLTFGSLCLVLFIFFAICLWKIFLCIIEYTTWRDVMLVFISYSLGLVTRKIYMQKQCNSTPLCTCVLSRHVYCKRHDQQLLWEISKKLPNSEFMFEVGISLYIDSDTIEACRENNRSSIVQAVYEMLYQKWYKEQDGLGMKSKGLKELKRAIKNTHKAGCMERILHKHFEERGLQI